MVTFTDRADYWADQYGVPRDIYRRLVTRESNWSPEAYNEGSKAYGLTQVRPDTARQPGYRVKPLTDPKNPDEQLRFGAEYLSAMMREHGGDTNKALAAYNWGVGNVEDWLEAGGDPNAMPEETRKYINFINPDGIKVTKLKDGTMEDGYLRGMVNSALEDAELQERLGGRPMIDPNLVDPAQSIQSQTQNEGLLAKLMPNLSDADRKQNLLAIGAGLLSGDDWTSGIEGAGQALFQVGSDRMARQAAAQKAASAGGFERIGSVMTPDGQIVGGVSYDPQNAEYFRIDEGGKRVPINGAIPLNNSDASGSRYATLAAKSAEQVKELRGTLSSIDKLMPNLEKMDYGVPGLLTDLKGFVKTLSGRTELSEEEIMRRIAAGQTQALVGKVREDVVGPGVMTEQDALRVLSALGGDATSILGNPEVAQRMLTEIYDRTYKRYNDAHDQYDAYRGFPGSVFVPLDRYSTPERGGSAPAAGGVDDILSTYGL